MQIKQTYSHHLAEPVLSVKDGILPEISTAFYNRSVILSKNNPRKIKTYVSHELNSLGWADSIRIGTTNLSVNYMKNRVALCLQLGNVARTYADILKVQYLFETKVIDLGILVVPDNVASRDFGTNYARFDRLVSELQLFESFIQAPIFVIGLGE
jgi:hypothetical protein